MPLRLEKDKMPESFSVIEERLKQEGIFLGEDREDVKTSPRNFSRRAIQAVNEALQAALKLSKSNDNLTEAARLLEKIQILATEAEKSAFIDHGHQAQLAYHMATTIATLSRHYFHEMKVNG